ncbi:MAG TPA: 16S rRNA (adenine(1518)-N(6)/adenine(1519)-N(6))-dimethyltransferase RsmA [Feifaniaceae bacterium]|nr:16S rRNA (adenine(1518)-N(6)/adenine(1519)-N(6))-dimethyltransferase RsmA [Feifaniaceae bacterium]
MGTQAQRHHLYLKMSAAFTHPLCSPAGIRERLIQFGLTPNKALGQNFLADAGARDALIDAMQIDGLPVIEIGPGLGALTERLLTRAKTVAAVEKDAAMVRVLRETLACPQLILVEADILKTDLAALHGELGGGPLAVAGNLPYYITTPIVLALLNHPLPIASMTLMLQQEAAERFFAQPGSRVYGPLTAAARCGYGVEEIIKLSPSAYFPQPDVHSAVVRLVSKDTPLPEGFLSFLQSAFAMRRKTLWNNLLLAGYPREAIREAMQAACLPEGVRAEALEPETLRSLYAHLNTSAAE